MFKFELGIDSRSEVNLSALGVSRMSRWITFVLLIEWSDFMTFPIDRGAVRARPTGMTRTYSKPDPSFEERHMRA